MRRVNLETTNQDIQIVRVAANSYSIRKIIDRQPDSYEARMCVERHRKFLIQCIMDGNAGNTEIDEMVILAEFLRKIGCPVLMIRIVGSNTECIGGSNCHVSYCSPRFLLLLHLAAGARLSNGRLPAAYQKGHKQDEQRNQ